MCSVVFAMRRLHPHRRRTFMSKTLSFTLIILFLFGNAFLLRTFVTNNDAIDSSNSIDNDVDDAMNQWKFVKSRQILDFREKEEFVLSRRKRRSVSVDVDANNGESKRHWWIDCDALTRDVDVGSQDGRQFVASGWTKAVYRARYRGRDVAIKQVNLNGHDATNCLHKEGQTPWECYRRSAAKIMKEIILLRELAHPNVLKVLGFCIPESDNEYGSQSGLSLITELGEALDVIRLLQSSWEDRFRIVLGVGRLVHYMSRSPLGSLVMNDFRRQQFVLVDGELKLSDVDDMELEEPSCEGATQSTCVSRHETAEVTLTVPCTMGRCNGHNEKQNIFNAGRHFVSFLLPHGAPYSLRPKVDTVVNAFANVTWDSGRLLRELEEIRRVFISGEYLENSGRGNGKKDGDGYVDLRADFVRFANSDLPGLHDYRCQLTVSGNGCMLSVYDDLEAMQICRSDRDCRAFVVTPQLTWTGRHITHFKNNSSEPVTKSGATLYVKETF